MPHTIVIFDNEETESLKVYEIRALDVFQRQ